MEFKEVIQKARGVSSLYDELNREQGHSKWELQHYVQGFMEDLGSLARLSMMKVGMRAPFDDLDEKLKHEICDCLWSTIRIADALNIDLEVEFPKQMDKLAKRIKEEKH
jgi:NTP pyrophosphatase (non-canonical NTP hydrolase)